MKTSTAALLGVFVLASTVGACSAAARLADLQPPSLADYHPAALSFHAVRRPRVQLGIDVDFYAHPDQDVTAIARSDVAYVKSLHANAMSVSFPFFASGLHSSEAYAGAETPSPADLAIVASVAEKAGLYLSIRPLLDASSIAGESRTDWRPSDTRAWFRNYERFLRPYARMAQKARIPEFIAGAELSEFQDSHYWKQLDAAIAKIFKGALAYSNNWYNQPGQSRQEVSGVHELVDAYPPVQVGQHASVAELTAGWSAYDRTLPRGTVLGEVGIAAQPGAYAKPFVVRWPGRPLVPAIQSRWFSAACDSAGHERLGGIYFWPMTFGQDLRAPPDAGDPGSFVDGEGASAIATCFQTLAGAAG